MINREINLPKNSSFFLLGPRQTGKSTLIRTQFLPLHTRVYDLLLSDTYTRYLANPSLIRDEVNNRPVTISHVVIDEIQRIPDLLNDIHALMESPRSPSFILTGSSARKLKRSQSNLLAGRALTRHLFPLSATELGERFSLIKALQVGTLPSIYLEESLETAQDRLRAYVDTYLREEIEREAQLRTMSPFIRFLAIAANENGNLINFSSIARDTGVSYQTVKAYFQILEDTLIGSLLFPYSKSQRKRLSMHPKFYFFDPGIVRALSKKLTVPLEPRSSEFGRAFEHFIILEIMRATEYRRMDLSFSYYRTESGTEVDLIIETPRNKTIAIEIKGRDTIDSPHLHGLYSFSQLRPDATLCCVCLAPYVGQQGKVTILPWQQMVEWIAGQ